MWLLLNLLPISDWLLYQQRPITLLFCRQIGAFQLLLFWNKLRKFVGYKLESFPQFSSNEVCNSVVFFYHTMNEYLQKFLGYEPFRFENVLIFLPFTEVSTYNFIYKNATSAILSVM